MRTDADRMRHGHYLRNRSRSGKRVSPAALTRMSLRRQQLRALRALARLQYDVTSEAEMARWNTLSTLIYRRLAGRQDIVGELFDSLTMKGN